MLVQMVCTGGNPEGWRDLVHGCILSVILYICPVFYAEVIFLRGREGQRLRRSEWPAAIFGEVVIEDSTATKGAFRRLMRRAVLTQTIGVSSVRTAAVIFDPYFLPSAEGAMLIAGVQLQHCVTTKTISEHGQVWLCRTRAVPDRPLPPVSAALERLLPEV